MPKLSLASKARTQSDFNLDSQKQSAKQLDSTQKRIDTAENQDNKSINDGELASTKREEIATYR